ncbi:MAG: CDP-glycerol glycerophosphotransferase family protein, partial [Hydrogenobaculum sp.]
LIWAPHHSVAKRWLGFGVFHKIYQDMTRLAKENKDIKIIFKPHPFLRRSLMEHNIMHKEEYDKWLEEFSNIENVEIYTGGDYFSIFSESDAMLTDGLSFLVEYPMATGKPLIFFDSKAHQPLNQIGELALEYAYKVDSFEDFKSILDHLIKSKQNKTKDNMYEKRIEILEEMERLLIPDKNPAEAILEDVLEDWYG